MRQHFSTQHQREAGRKRALGLTKDTRSLGGHRTSSQHRNTLHCQTIAPEGFLSWSAYAMRGRTGLSLLVAEQIHFLRVEDMAGKYGTPLSEREQRLQFGLYVWKATFDGLAWPRLPDDAEFLADVARVQSCIGQGLPLPHPLDALYCAPNDFCDPGGIPWSRRKQRKLFRDALRRARDYAIRLAPMLAETMREPLSRPLLLALPAGGASKPGRRRQVGQARPQFPGLLRPAIRYRYGRPNLPWYDRENISPTRPFRAAQSASITAWYAEACSLSDRDDEA